MKKTKIFCLVLVFTMILGSFINVFAATQGRIQIAPQKASVKQGDIFTVEVDITKNPGIISISMLLDYSEGLELIGTEDKKVLSGGVLSNNYSNENYKLTWINHSASADSKSTGTVAVLTFKVKEDAPVGKQTISLSTELDTVYNISGDQIEFICESTEITVQCAHSYGEWLPYNDGSHKRICSECGHIDYGAHTKNNMSVIKEPTHLEEGIGKYECDVCKATFESSVPKTEEHSFGEWHTVKEPASDEEGVAERICELCGYKESKALDMTDGSIGIIVAAAVGVIAVIAVAIVIVIKKKKRA
ncbi:MAG: hypothetical protein J6C89_02845 [Clostridia bacterium]|nr:hypothetical protein [Clostridia bacterium]